MIILRDAVERIKNASDSNTFDWIINDLRIYLKNLGMDLKISSRASNNSRNLAKLSLMVWGAGFPQSSETKQLKEIAVLGFEKLGIQIEDAVATQIAIESLSSPQ